METKMPGPESLPGTTIAGFRVNSMLARDPGGLVTFAVVAEEGGEAGTLHLAADAGSSGLGDRLLHDARALADIDHPSLPSVLATGVSEEGAYVVTGEARARSLTSVIDGGLPPRQAIRMLAEVGEALDVAHGAGLLHRRLRPDSLVVGQWLVVRPLVVNFALGRVRGGAEAVEDEQVPYAAPEELAGKSVGPAADNYAFGATLFELIVGTPPFGSARDAAREGHLQAPPPRPTDLVPGLPPGVDAVFARALDKDPEARYRSAAALVTELSRALSGHGPTESAPADPSPATAVGAATPVWAEETGLWEGGVDSDPPAAPRAPEARDEPAEAAPADRGPEPGWTSTDLAALFDHKAVEDERSLAPAVAPFDPERDTDEGEALDPGRKVEGLQKPPWRPDAAAGGRAPVPDEAAARPERLRGILRRRVSLRVSVALVLVAALAGLLLGRAGGEGGPAISTASTGPLSLEVIEGWTRSRSTPGIGGLRLDRPVAIAAVSGGGVVAGAVRGQSAAFDPGSVAETVGGARPRAALVRLGSVRALRWQGLRAGTPAVPVTLFAVPIPGGAVAVACHGRSLAAGIPEGCAQTAASLRLGGVTPYDPVAAARWRRRAREVIRSLRERREAGLRRLSGAATDTDHAGAALSLAEAHQTAIRDLARDGAPPQATAVQREITAALDGLMRSYRDLARASREANAAAHVSAGQAAARHDARLRRALKPI